MSLFTSGPLTTAAALQLSCRYAAVRTEQTHGLLVDMKREFLAGTDLFWGHRCKHRAIRTANPSDSGGGQNSTDEAMIGFSKAYADQIDSYQ